MSLQSLCCVFLSLCRGPCIFMCPMDASILSAHAKATAWALQKNLIDWPANWPRRRRSRNSRRAPVDDRSSVQENKVECKNLREAGNCRGNKTQNGRKGNWGELFSCNSFWNFRFETEWMQRRVVYCTIIDLFGGVLWFPFLSISYWGVLHFLEFQYLLFVSARRCRQISHLCECVGKVSG